MTLSNSPSEGRSRRRTRQSGSSIARQVSEEALKDGKENAEGRSSPIRCVSEFDKVAGTTTPPSRTTREHQDHATLSSSTLSTAASDTPPHSPLSSPISPSPSPIPHFPNPLHNPKIFAAHSTAVRLEAELLPLFVILSRVMSHQTLNRKGLFNVPVDPVALNIPDYFSIITKPMDLGTVKARLHAIAYQSREQVVEDIRLVFANAMKYNPPQDVVHSLAQELLDFFEEQLRLFLPEFAASMAASKLESAPRVVEEIRVKSGAGPVVLQTVTTEPGEGRAELKPPPTPSVVVGSGVCFPCTHTATASSSTTKRVTPLSIKAPTVHTIKTAAATRKNTPPGQLSPSSDAAARKRQTRGITKKNPGHNCQWCQSRTCSICNQGCLALEPTLLVCNGPQCIGARIRKGGTYYIAPDGSRQYCDRCYVSLPATIPVGGRGHTQLLRRDLLKRKNDEEVVEQWLNCKKCKTSVHRACSMHNEYAPSSQDDSEYVCPDCMEPASSSSHPPVTLPRKVSTVDQDSNLYTFVSGSDSPVKLSDFAGPDFNESQYLSADSLPETELSVFIQAKVKERMASVDCPNAERTVVVRVVSDCNMFFKVPEVVRKHFQMSANKYSEDQRDEAVPPPERVSYTSKAIALFQKIDGLDVCIFCMYVQEHDGCFDYESDEDSCRQDQKRVYIAYLDSVEHFRPRSQRTLVYHEILVAYMAAARKQGYETAHIWACPPSRGNSFVFWNHPATQKTPSRDRLLDWYHALLSRAVDCGVVTDVESLYDTCFKAYVEERDADDDACLPSGRMPCPPLLDGDFWIEQAVRFHAVHMQRQTKARTADGQIMETADLAFQRGFDQCPALEVAAMLRSRVIADPIATLFRRPVNAAALKLDDYHKIIKNPMDLGTVHSRCVLGEYATLEDMVADVELVVSNAKKYNPRGHYVHVKAEELSSLFFSALNELTAAWDTVRSHPYTSVQPWHVFRRIGMSLDDVPLEKPQGSNLNMKACTTPQPLHTQRDGPSSPRAVATASVSEPSSGVGCTDAKVQATETSTQDTSKPVGAQRMTQEAKVAPKPIQQEADLLTGGADAVELRMVGEDTWLLDRKNHVVNKPPPGFLKRGRRRKSTCTVGSTESDQQPSAKRRRQSWLGEEVGGLIRRMRTDFFSCRLTPAIVPTQAEARKLESFELYSTDFDVNDVGKGEPVSSQIVDARHSFLEVSQFRNLEFDTLRHAKYSTAVLLYHLHNSDAPGMVPCCTTCGETIKSVRWHKINRVVELRPNNGGKVPARGPTAGRKPLPPVEFQPEELCSECHKDHVNGDQFIPLQVSFSS